MKMRFEDRKSMSDAEYLAALAIEEAEARLDADAAADLEKARQAVDAGDLEDARRRLEKLQEEVPVPRSVA